MSRSAALGADRRLADPVALTRAAETPPNGSGQCTSALGAGGAQRPQERPGTYYWQAWRLCTGCPTSDYETGPVRKLIVRANAKAKVKPPARAWAGYPFALAVSLPGIGNGAPIRIERKAGKKWKRVATTEALGERAEAVVTLKRGHHTLRAIATIGSQAVTSAGRTIRVVRAAGWKTSRSDDGAYRAKSVRFKAAIRRMKIAPDGGFIAAATPDSATSILVRGTLGRGKVTKGRVQLSVGDCSGSRRFSARR